MKIYNACILLLLACALAEPKTDCPIKPFKQALYFVVSSKKTWKQAQKLCENWGGGLATITNKFEENNISDLSYRFKKYWINLYFPNQQQLEQAAIEGDKRKKCQSVRTIDGVMGFSEGRCREKRGFVCQKFQIGVISACAPVNDKAYVKESTQTTVIDYEALLAQRTKRNFEQKTKEYAVMVVAAQIRVAEVGNDIRARNKRLVSYLYVSVAAFIFFTAVCYGCIFSCECFMVGGCCGKACFRWTFCENGFCTLKCKTDKTGEGMCRDRVSTNVGCKKSPNPAILQNLLLVSRYSPERPSEIQAHTSDELISCPIDTMKRPTASTWLKTPRPTILHEPQPIEPPVLSMVVVSGIGFSKPKKIKVHVTKSARDKRMHEDEWSNVPSAWRVKLKKKILRMMAAHMFENSSNRQNLFGGGGELAVPSRNTQKAVTSASSQGKASRSLFFDHPPPSHKPATIQSLADPLVNQPGPPRKVRAFTWLTQAGPPPSSMPPNKHNLPTKQLKSRMIKRPKLKPAKKVSEQTEEIKKAQENQQDTLKMPNRRSKQKDSLKVAFLAKLENKKATIDAETTSMESHEARPVSQRRQKNQTSGGFSSPAKPLFKKSAYATSVGKSFQKKINKMSQKMANTNKTIDQENDYKLPNLLNQTEQEQEIRNDLHQNMFETTENERDDGILDVRI